MAPRTRVGLLLRVAALCAAVCCACAVPQASLPTAGPATLGQGSSAGAAPTATVVSVPGVFAGVGSSRVTLWIDPGTWTMSITHEGRAEFRVLLLNQEGQSVGDLAQGVGKYHELTSQQIRRSGLYDLQVTADGPWSVDIRGCTCSGELS